MPPSKFQRAKPAPPVTDEAIEAFAAGAVERKAERVTPAPAPRRPALDPDAPLTRGINVRFNEYHLSLIKKVAKMEDRSAQKIILKLLVPALEKAAKGE